MLKTHVGVAFVCLEAETASGVGGFNCAVVGVVQGYATQPDRLAVVGSWTGTISRREPTATAVK